MDFLGDSIIFSSLGFGIQTSICPCPMATNIAALSYLGKNISNSRLFLLSGLLYTLGRTAAYILVTILMTSGYVNNPEFTAFLRNYGSIIVAPVLIIIGIILMEWLSFGFGKSGFSEKFMKKVAALGLPGTFFLGFLFAMSFCPVSLGLFLGNVINISSNSSAGENIIPAIAYGIGTALPVLLFAALLSYGSKYIGKFYNNISKIQWWAQRIAGIIFIAAGLYLGISFF